MTAIRMLVLAAAGVALFGCATSAKTVQLRADARAMGGIDASASMEVPEGWYQSGKRADRLVFSAPDNFSSLTLSLQSLRGDPARCPELAQSAAADAARHPSAKADLLSPAEGVTDWHLTVPANPPGPSDRYVQGRAMCRAGALAVVTCSTGIARKDTTGVECAKVLASLSIGGAAGPAPTSIVVPVAAVAGNESKPAAAAPEPAPAGEPAAEAPKAAEANRELPVAGMIDAALEKDFVDAFQSQKWDGTPVKAVITDKDWSIVKNEATGAIVRRWLGATVAYKLADGSCKLRPLAIEQIWDGLAYGKSSVSGQSSEPQDIDCAKVK